MLESFVSGEWLTLLMWLKYHCMSIVRRVKKRKFSLHIRTCEVRESAISSQFESAFKIKAITATTAVASAAGTPAYSAIHVELVWWKLKGPLLPPKSVVFPRTTSGPLKSGGEMNSWAKLHNRSVHSSKPTVPYRREASRLRRRRQRLPTLPPRAWQSRLSG